MNGAIGEVCDDFRFQTHDVYGTAGETIGCIKRSEVRVSKSRQIGKV